MKLHVKHLKSNKKVNFLSFNYFAYSIFEEEKKKVGEEKKKKKKMEKSFLVLKTLVFPISTQCLHHFFARTSHYGAGLGLLAHTEGRMGVQITGEHWLLSSTFKR